MGNVWSLFIGEISGLILAAAWLFFAQ